MSYLRITRQELSVGHPNISAVSSCHSWTQRRVMSGFPNNGFLTRYDLRIVVVRLHSLQYLITEFNASSSLYPSSSFFPSMKRRRCEVRWDFQRLDCPLRSKVNLIISFSSSSSSSSVAPLSKKDKRFLTFRPPSTHILRYLYPCKNAKLS